jgi:NADP-dependent 3-hydroxy acid dehydrogenase YdfG
MKISIYIAAEISETVSIFLKHLDKNQLNYTVNPESKGSADIETADFYVIFLSDILLKSYKMRDIFDLKITKYNCSIVILNELRSESGILTEQPIRISTVHEVMQYRDYWYEEWLKLRRLYKNNADNEQCDTALFISTHIGAFLRHALVISPIDWLSFSQNDFSYFRDKMGYTEVLTEISEIANNKQEVLLPEPELLSLNTNLSEFEIKEKDVEPETADGDLMVQENASLKAVDIIEEVDNKEYIDIKLLESEPITVPTPINTAEIMETLNFENTNEEKHWISPETVDDSYRLKELAIEATISEEYMIARKYLERLLQVDPMSAFALRHLAKNINTHSEGELNYVDELFKKALVCHEEDAELYFEYAEHLSKNLNNFQRAADMYQRAIEMYPNFEEAYFGLALCQYEMGQQPAAKANYLQAFLLNSEIRTAEKDQMFGVYNPSPVSEEMEALKAEPLKHPNGDTIVMVTGGSSGIGKAVAEQFALNGYKVIITGRRNERLQEIKTELLGNYDAEIETLSFDVRDPESINKALEQLPEEWKNVDILINNAGLAKGRSPIQEGNLHHWETMIDTNIKGLLYITRALTPGMVERQKGFIINIGSVAGKEAYVDGNVYCATKAAVDMLTKGMRLDLHKHGIRVAAVHPGHVETEFALVRFDGDEQKANIYENFTPLNAADVAETVYYIASRPAHVNIQDVLMFATQQASATVIDMSGKKYID